jgi:hypothetical protein
MDGSFRVTAMARMPVYLNFSFKGRSAERLPRVEDAL